MSLQQTESSGAPRLRGPGRTARWMQAALLMAAAALAVYIAVAQQSESARPQLLNSERIEQRFGSYGIDVLESDGKLRVSSLYSLENGRKVCRTFAVVLYPSEVDPRYADAHAAILAGGSIGAVFKQRGWSVTKKNLYFGTLAPTPRVAALMRDDSGRPLAVHVYGLYVTKGDATLPYATIAEVHHADYLTLAELRDIYGGPDPVPAEAAGVVQRLLAVTDEKMR
jgi:hypothetical protein